jgi:uncharacterized hydrophobic protein (TIGR00271 family)
MKSKYTTGITKNLLDHFRLNEEKEDASTMIEAISSGIIFRATNLWILIFAIFIASLGLNVNSTAVIIGAMLISPLMGPIMGMGLGLGINDLGLLRRSVSNFSFAIGVGLTTSTLYFLLTPISDAHSELLARTAPNIYDVLIAFFGGLAGVIAASSKLKGNVIPGVAIATALMPPLCTAGYGIATLQWSFFFGAFYLFTINTVFIALATFLTVRFLKFPYVTLPDKKAESRARQSISVIIILTLIPSIYLGFVMVQSNRFEKNAMTFIEKECHFENDYLLKKTIDHSKKTITLTFMGDGISDVEIEAVKQKLASFNLSKAQLSIIQGFAWLKEKTEINENLHAVISSTGEQLKRANRKQDSINQFNDFNMLTAKELQALYPPFKSAAISRSYALPSSADSSLVLLAVLSFSKPVSTAEKKQITEWLKVRYNEEQVKVVFERISAR